MIKKGSHLEGVEPINEKNIIVEILHKKIGELIERKLKKWLVTIVFCM